MDPITIEYANRVFKLVLKATAQMVIDPNDSVQIVLKISESDALSIIKKIIIGLPERHLYNKDVDTITLKLGLIAKLFILFQVQENIDDLDYPYHLINFIESVSVEMDKITNE